MASVDGTTLRLLADSREIGRKPLWVLRIVFLGYAALSLLALAGAAVFSYSADPAFVIGRVLALLFFYWAGLRLFSTSASEAQTDGPDSNTTQPQ